MLYSFLLVGQSNMAGRGLLDEVDMICDPRIKMLRNGIWMPMTEPVQCDFPWAGISLAPTFASAWLKDHPDDEIGFIPCAHGATSVDNWLEGSILFDNAVMQAELAERRSRLAGILWHQGETDCTSEGESAYLSKLVSIFRALREHLGRPDIPIVLGELGHFVKDAAYLECSTRFQNINKMIHDCCEELESCWYVTAEGLSGNPDQLHFNAASLRVFGLRYYEAYRTKENLIKPLPEEPDFRALTPPPTGMERIQMIHQSLYDSPIQF